MKILLLNGYLIEKLKQKDTTGSFSKTSKQSAKDVGGFHLDLLWG